MQTQTLVKNQSFFLKQLPFPTVDVALAKHLLKNYPSATEASMAFIAYLSLATRQGHLCVTCEEPAIKDLWVRVLEQDQSVTFDWDLLTGFIKQGSLELPEDLVTDVAHDPKTPLCRHENRFYFQRYWQDETQFIHHFHRIRNSPPNFALEITELNGFNLLPEQADAIRNCARQTLSIISGGPGTGKTHTVGVFLERLTKVMPADAKIVLAAPTGKAAANLQASIQRAMKSELSNLKATTLHSLLGISKSSYEYKKILADIIIVDECSMIDAELMQRLFSSVKSGCRLILLGDPNQLPPVEAGSLFGDLLNAAPELTTTLKTCLRAESQGIIEFAAAIINGDSDKVMRLLGDEIPFVKLEKAKPVYACSNDPEKMFAEMLDFRILSPLRRGPFGVDAINVHCLKKAMASMRGKGTYGFPVLITGNDSQMDLFNGELGILVREGPIFDTQPKAGDYALFPSRGDKGMRRIPALLLPNYDYAYCLSVHKSQGSEFNRVLLLMPPGSEVFGRKVFYTGATRARKQLEVWSTQEIINQTITRNYQRMSGLPFRLRNHE